MKKLLLIAIPLVYITQAYSAAGRLPSGHGSNPYGDLNPSRTLQAYGTSPRSSLSVRPGSFSSSNAGVQKPPRPAVHPTKPPKVANSPTIVKSPVIRDTQDTTSIPQTQEAYKTLLTDTKKGMEQLNVLVKGYNDTINLIKKQNYKDDTSVSMQLPIDMILDQYRKVINQLDRLRQSQASGAKEKLPLIEETLKALPQQFMELTDIQNIHMLAERIKKGNPTDKDLGVMSYLKASYEKNSELRSDTQLNTDLSVIINYIKEKNISTPYAPQAPVYFLNNQLAQQSVIKKQVSGANLSRQSFVDVKEDSAKSTQDGADTSLDYVIPQAPPLPPVAQPGISVEMRKNPMVISVNRFSNQSIEGTRPPGTLRNSLNQPSIRSSIPARPASVLLPRSSVVQQESAQNMQPQRNSLHQDESESRRGSALVGFTLLDADASNSQQNRTVNGDSALNRQSIAANDSRPLDFVEGSVAPGPVELPQPKESQSPMNSSGALTIVSGKTTPPVAQRVFTNEGATKPATTDSASKDIPQLWNARLQKSTSGRNTVGESVNGPSIDSALNKEVTDGQKPVSKSTSAVSDIRGGDTSGDPKIGKETEEQDLDFRNSFPVNKLDDEYTGEKKKIDNGNLAENSAEKRYPEGVKEDQKDGYDWYIRDKLEPINSNFSKDGVFTTQEQVDAAIKSMNNDASFFDLRSEGITLINTKKNIDKWNLELDDEDYIKGLRAGYAILKKSSEKNSDLKVDINGLDEKITSLEQQLQKLKNPRSDVNV